MKPSEHSARLRAVPLFAGLSDDDLERLASGTTVVSLTEGSLLFEEGDKGGDAFVIEEGEVEILKITGQREVLLARRVAGEVIGEMSLLDAAPRMATARAATDVSLLAIPRDRLDELLATSAAAARALFMVLLSRWRETQSKLRQSERMAQLGTLTAGLAHELNNPAAAVKRSAHLLGSAVRELVNALSSPVLHAMSFDGYLESGPVPRLGALERADREDEVEQLLSTVGLEASMAGEIVAAGLDAADIELLIGDHGEDAGAAIDAVVAIRNAKMLVSGIEEGVTRMSAIVKALKSYSYLDQAPFQEVDIREGIVDTLTILEHKLRDVDVQLDLDKVPPIMAAGSELNQVWTNLLDNAADALVGTPDPTIRVRAGLDGEEIFVEFEDNGPGIPKEVVPRIFDAFFTTKPPGQGTGLGLDISYSIVVHRHRGELTVESHPGSTVFRVLLPIEGAAS